MLRRLAKQFLIREGEAGSIAYFLIFFLLSGTGMAIGRGTTDALFLKRIGIEYLPLMYMVQSVVLAMVSLVYAAFADRLIAEKLFRIIFATLAALVLGCWLVMSGSNSTLVYPAYYLVYEVASEVLLVHAALYMGQNMTTLQAKRLAPLVYAGSQTGFILGGLLLAGAAPRIGAHNLLMIWCIILTTGLVLLIAWHRHHGPSSHFRAPPRSRNLLHECVTQVHQGLRYTWSSDLLRAAAFALFFMVISYYILCYSVNRVYTRTFTDEAALAGFFGVLTATTSTIALLAQLFVTNRVIRHFGIRRINLVFPWTTIAALSTLAMSYTLPAALFGSLNKDALMPAFRTPVRALFVNVIPVYMQGRARAISVAVVLPVALFVCGLLLEIMQKTQSPELFLLPGVATALLYLYFNRNMNRAYEGTLIRTMKEKLFLPDQRLYTELNGAGRGVFEEIIEGFNHPDPPVALAYARLLIASFPEQAAEPILKRIESADAATADQLVALLKEVDIARHRDRIFALTTGSDAHLHASAMWLLSMTDEPFFLDHARQLTGATNPRLRAAGLHYCLCYPEAPGDRDGLLERWRGLLRGDTGSCLAAYALIPDLERLDPAERERLETEIRDSFVRMLALDDRDIRARALRGLGLWRGELPVAAYPALAQALAGEDPASRTVAAGCLHLPGDYPRTRHILRAIADSHPGVRQAGIESLQAVSRDFTATAFELVLENGIPLRGQIALLESLMAAGLPNTDCERIALGKAGEARQLQDAIQVLESTGGPESGPELLIKLVLQERLEQTVQLALLALEPLHEPGIIHTIRAGFSSRDQRHIANAGEALDGLEGGDATRLLQQVLSSMLDHPDRHRTPGFGSLTEVIDWCSRHADEWLRECAGYYLRETTAGVAHV